MGTTKTTATVTGIKPGDLVTFVDLRGAEIAAKVVVARPTPAVFAKFVKTKAVVGDDGKIKVPAVLEDREVHPAALLLDLEIPGMGFRPSVPRLSQEAPSGAWRPGVTRNGS